MAKFIKLKAFATNSPLYINTTMLGSFIPTQSGSAIFITKRNGSIQVTETPDEILRLIEGVE